MTTKEVLKELESYGDPAIKAIYLRRGIHEPVFGVRVQDMKKIVKKVKKNHELSLELYATGNSDAMYLAGLIADETKITKAQLKRWLKGAYHYGLYEYTVAWVASESKHGYALGLEWIDSDREDAAATGWSILAYWAALHPDSELDLELYSELLSRVEKNIHSMPSRVRYTMNGFVIAIGSYVIPLNKKAIEVGKRIGKVDVKVENASCKVPYAPDYIQKVVDKGNLGKKRKMARC